MRLVDATDQTRIAAVDAAGNVQVKVNNLPGDQQITGTVSIDNLPAVQQVSGTVTVAPPSGRVILLATGLIAPSSNFNSSPVVDTSDCRSLTAMLRGGGNISDFAVGLVQENPDGSGFGLVSGTTAGIMTYFTVGGTPVASPRAGVAVQSTTGDPITLDKVWLFCGH